MSEAKILVLKEALAACLGTDPGDIDPEINLIESGILDSLDSMKFLFEVEKRSASKIGDDVLDESMFSFNGLLPHITLN